MLSSLCVAALTTVSSAPNLVGLQVQVPFVALGGASAGEREGRRVLGCMALGQVLLWPASQTVTQAGWSLTVPLV